ALAPDAALRVVVQACRGIEAAHAAGVIHRDIKSSNFFLAADEGGGKGKKKGRRTTLVVKVLDFGIAEVASFGTSSGSAYGRKLTQTGDVMGSPAYMSPEQISDSKSVDARSDVWSLGVVLYEALSGKTPHADEPNIARLLRAIEEKPAPSLALRAPW